MFVFPHTVHVVADIFVIMKQISIYMKLAFIEYYYLISLHAHTRRCDILSHLVPVDAVVALSCDYALLEHPFPYPCPGLCGVSSINNEVHPHCMCHLALLVPWIPVIAAFATGGFFNSSYPPLLCVGRNADAIFYSLIVPLIIMVQIGVTMLVVIFWTLHKVWYCKHALK